MKSLFNTILFFQGHGRGPGFPFPGDGEFPGNEDNNPFEPGAPIDQHILFVFIIAALIGINVLWNPKKEITKRRFNQVYIVLLIVMIVADKYFGLGILNL